MPLRLIEIDRNHLPELPKRGMTMPLERVLAIAMLDPNSRYYPIDIARIAFAYELQQGRLSDSHVALLNMRRGFSQLSQRAMLGSNVALSGAQWFGLVHHALRPLAELMDELKALMAQNPGVVYTYHQDKLIPYPDQRVSPVPFQPPKWVQERAGKIVFETAEAPDVAPLESDSILDWPEVRRDDPPVLEASIDEEDEPDPAVTCGHDLFHDRSLQRIIPAYQAGHANPGRQEGEPSQVRVDGWRRKWMFAALFFLTLLVPGATALYWYQLDEVNLDDIHEQGIPSGEPGYFIAGNQRYEVGDRLRFEGEVGVIQQIRREYLVVGEHTYPAPTLYFFGLEMGMDGNLVVYPGSPRHIAGNFWIAHSRILDDAAAGYLSWYGGFKDREYAAGDACELFAFWAEVTGKQLACKGNYRIAVPPNIQFEELFEQCLTEGATMQQFDDFMEVTWP